MVFLFQLTLLICSVMQMKHVGGLQRSNFLNQFRNLAAEIFEGIVPLGHFKRGFDRHEDPLCQRLLGFKSAGVYNRHPPCLFADGFVTGATVFRTIYGVKVCLAYLSLKYRESDNRCRFLRVGYGLAQLLTITEW